MLIRDSGREHIILRFATVFGSSPRMRLDLLVNDFVYQAVHNRQIVLFEGYFRRTFLHSADAAAVYPFAMSHFDGCAAKVFNVGDESMNYTKREITLKIKEYVDFYLHEAAIGTDPDQRRLRGRLQAASVRGFPGERGPGRRNPRAGEDSSRALDLEPTSECLIFQEELPWRTAFC